MKRLSSQNQRINVVKDGKVNSVNYSEEKHSKMRTEKWPLALTRFRLLVTPNKANLMK